jgi:ribosomal protein S18 acetylase RimI-like enzyme
MDEAAVVVVRLGTKEDLPCIYSTWRNSAYYAGGGHRREKSVTRATFFRDLNYKIKHILEGAVVHVACLSDSPNTILGYGVFTGSHINWVYIKPDYRRQGLARRLCPTMVDSITSTPTPLGATIANHLKLTRKED